MSTKMLLKNKLDLLQHLHESYSNGEIESIADINAYDAKKEELINLGENYIMETNIQTLRKVLISPNWIIPLVDVNMQTLDDAKVIEIMRDDLYEDFDYVLQGLNVLLKMTPTI